jgi:hypothetical protein
MGPIEVAVVMRNLMNRLGFKKYYVQGGDWGSIIGSNMATFFPKVRYENYCFLFRFIANSVYDEKRF